MVLLRSHAVKDLHVHRHMQITVRPVVSGAGHDLSGPLYELVTAVLALGEAPP